MRKHLLLVLTVGFILGLLWLLVYSLSTPPAEPSPQKQSTPPPSTETPPAREYPEQAMGDRILADYASPSSNGKEDIKLFYNYLTNVFLLLKSRDTQQYAINEDLSALLRGKNNYKTPFVSPDSHIFNEEKMIIDRWGTPIHIHTISSDVFELRSAGPDKKLFTQDDPIWPIPQPEQ
ncbi:MAG: hypothetical protein ACSHYF_08075 [Verrucomicrobiaceae bacterium]